MSSLPLISHHLFAAAVSEQPDHGEQFEHSEGSSSLVSNPIPLELLTWDGERPELTARPLRPLHGLDGT